jgi:hypothetical protein
MRKLALALSFVPMLAFAQAAELSGLAAPAAPTDTVLIPRSLVPMIEQAVLHPHMVDAGDALTLLQQLEACVADNPVDGVTRREGQDKCPLVTQTLETQAQALANAKKATAPAKSN